MQAGAAGKRVQCPRCATIQRVPGTALKISNSPATSSDSAPAVAATSDRATSLRQPNTSVDLWPPQLAPRPASPPPLVKPQPPPAQVAPTHDDGPVEAADAKKVSTPAPQPSIAKSKQEYAAFISYRHVEPDHTWAKQLHRALEQYRVPRQLATQRRVPSRLGKVFRDDDELSASPDLKREIESALVASRFLIVICSPRTPKSEWVNQEVLRFRELGRHDRIVALLIEGEPSQSFPKALCEIRRKVIDRRGMSREQIAKVEPLAADVRPVASESRRAQRQIATLKIAACLLGCKFDNLRMREQERRRRNLIAWGSAAACVLALVVTLAARVVSQGTRLEQYVMIEGELQQEGDRIKHEREAAETLAMQQASEFADQKIAWAPMSADQTAALERDRQATLQGLEEMTLTNLLVHLSIPLGVNYGLAEEDAKSLNEILARTRQNPNIIANPNVNIDPDRRKELEAHARERDELPGRVGQNPSPKQSNSGDNSAEIQRRQELMIQAQQNREKRMSFTQPGRFPVQKRTDKKFKFDQKFILVGNLGAVRVAEGNLWIYLVFEDFERHLPQNFGMPHAQQVPGNVPDRFSQRSAVSLTSFVPLQRWVGIEFKGVDSVEPLLGCQVGDRIRVVVERQHWNQVAAMDDAVNAVQAFLNPEKWRGAAEQFTDEAREYRLFRAKSEHELYTNFTSQKQMYWCCRGIALEKAADRLSWWRNGGDVSRKPADPQVAERLLGNFMRNAPRFVGKTGVAHGFFLGARELTGRSIVTLYVRDTIEGPTFVMADLGNKVPLTELADYVPGDPIEAKLTLVGELAADAPEETILREHYGKSAKKLVPKDAVGTPPAALFTTVRPNTQPLARIAQSERADDSIVALVSYPNSLPLDPLTRSQSLAARCDWIQMSKRKETLVFADGPRRLKVQARKDAVSIPPEPQKVRGAKP